MMPPGIYGRVTVNGAPAAGERLELRFFDGFAWSTLRWIDTDINGEYVFLDIPALELGQRYYVRYANRADVEDRLLFWGTRELTAYSRSQAVEIGNFDIANVALTAPPAGATVTLPYAFRWAPRPATPTDSYEFNLYDAASLDPYFFVKVGYLETTR